MWFTYPAPILKIIFYMVQNFFVSSMKRLIFGSSEHSLGFGLANMTKSRLAASDTIMLNEHCSS